MQIIIPKSQQERVIAVCSDGQYRTLERIQKEIKLRYGKYDTTPAISARLRENDVLFRYGFVKEKCRIFNSKTGKACHYYTLKRVAHE
jgi:hypothetical protein